MPRKLLILCMVILSVLSLSVAVSAQDDPSLIPTDLEAITATSPKVPEECC